MVKRTEEILLHKTNVGIVIVAKRCPSKNELYRAAHVSSGTYAAELVERFHEFFLGRATDVKKEYDDYYADEYEDVSHLLYHRYGMSPGHLRTLMPALQSDVFVGISEWSWGRDWQVQSLMEHCEEGPDVILTALGATWVESSDEDQV